MNINISPAWNRYWEKLKDLKYWLWRLTAEIVMSKLKVFGASFYPAVGQPISVQ